MCNFFSEYFLYLRLCMMLPFYLSLFCAHRLFLIEVRNWQKFLWKFCPMLIKLDQIFWVFVNYRHIENQSSIIRSMNRCCSYSWNGCNCHFWFFCMRKKNDARNMCAPFSSITPIIYLCIVSSDDEIRNKKNSTRKQTNHKENEKKSTVYAKYSHTKFTYAPSPRICTYDDRRKNYSSSNKSLS